MLSIPLWPDFRGRTEIQSSDRDDLRSDAAQRDREERLSQEAKRQKDGDDRKRDPLILNRFEKILAMAEMVNVDRPTDDRDDDEPSAETSSMTSR
jgi:nitric oxide reductase NorD protein